MNELEFQEIPEEFKCWYKPHIKFYWYSDYNNMLYKFDDYYWSFSDYIDKLKWEGVVISYPVHGWMWGTEKYVYSVPNIEDYLLNDIDERMYEGAREEVLALCKKEFIELTNLLEKIENKMLEEEIFAYNVRHREIVLCEPESFELFLND